MASTPDRREQRSVEASFANALQGDRAALARLLSLIERGSEESREVARLAYPRSGAAYAVGITGAPGAGKSTLTSALISHLRANDQAVAVLAIDPSSPFTGGAILGDRVRMQEHALDSGVFVRSMATRGHLGGLSLSTPEAIRLLDAVGWPWIVVETVGVGQVEVEVASTADTTVVVVNPGWGDAIQANKAGLMEIADVFVVNKADRTGAAQARHDLETMLDLSMSPSTDWRPPVVETTATNGSGVEELWNAVIAHRTRITETGQLAAHRMQRQRVEMNDIIVRRLQQRARSLAGAATWDELIGEMLARGIDPWTAVDQLLDPIGA